MISILGIPYDADSSFLKGAVHGPPVIRNAFKSPGSSTFAENEIDVGNHPQIRDEGDLDLGSGQNARDQIESAIRHLVMQDRKVLSLGGDHSITYPILRGYSSKHGKLNVLQLDAHPDLYDELDGNRYSHACPFARAFEDGLIDNLLQVGIRTMNTHQRRQANKFKVEIIRAEDVVTTMVEIDGPVYVSLDLDVLEPAFAPGVSHYEPGGLSVRDILSVIQEIEAPIIGADIVELNPTRDIQNMTAMVAAKFMKELLAKML
ncbi:MAG: agmatinase [Gammaproteobacteria bacterium]|nr:agmatinase [Gammaproteobacteria bacterium]